MKSLNKPSCLDGVDISKEALANSCIQDFRYYFGKLQELIKSGEISNKNNLNTQIYLERTGSYGNFVCRYLEMYIEEINKNKHSYLKGER